MPKNKLPESDWSAAAYDLAARLTLIPDFPNREQAIRHIAEWLLDRCSDQAQAEWLISTAVRDWERGWTGLWDLEALYNAKFNPALKPPQTQRPPEILCQTCRDTGVIVIECAGADQHAWCSCQLGQEMKTANPRYLELANARPMRKNVEQLSPDARPARKAAVAIDAAAIDRIKETQRLNRARGGRV